MKAQTVTKLNSLLNMGVPKSLHQDRSHHDIVEYVTPDHVACVVAFIDTGDDHVRLCGETDECNDLRQVFKTQQYQVKAKFSRKYLMDILSNLDSDTVTLRMGEDSLIIIKGKTEDVVIEGAIAPIIEDDEQ